jgi:hypothetical protein
LVQFWDILKESEEKMGEKGEVGRGGAAKDSPSGQEEGLAQKG